MHMKIWFSPSACYNDYCELQQNLIKAWLWGVAERFCWSDWDGYQEGNPSMGDLAPFDQTPHLNRASTIWYSSCSFGLDFLEWTETNTYCMLDFNWVSPPWQTGKFNKIRAPFNSTRHMMKIQKHWVLTELWHHWLLSRFSSFGVWLNPKSYFEIQNRWAEMNFQTSCRSPMCFWFVLFKIHHDAWICGVLDDSSADFKIKTQNWNLFIFYCCPKWYKTTHSLNKRAYFATSVHRNFLFRSCVDGVLTSGASLCSLTDSARWVLLVTC